MATIHRATDVRLERTVAVKLLRPEVASDPDLAHRFRREALAATVLRHPNIVACLDTGTDGAQAYLVMDLIEGEDLAARLRRGGRVAPWQAARIGLDVARALGAAHLRGIVHRDVKPGNILLAADGRAMVADFGIARLAMDAEADLPGTTLGSVHYFSPEQARGTMTTPASDVYGLGLVLFEALTGTRAWTGDTTDAIALARVGRRAPSARAMRPEIPAALEAVVARALQPEPGDRYPNGTSMAAALEPIVAATDPSSPTSVVAMGAAADHVVPVPTPPGEHGKQHDDRPTIPRRATRSLALIAAVSAMAVMVGGIVVATRPSPNEVLRPSVQPTPSAVAEATRQPAPDPTFASIATSEPDPSLGATPELTALPPGEVADLCEIFFDAPCGLGPGRYAPSRFQPAFDIELGEGWSSAAHRDDIVSLIRDEGHMTFGAAVTGVFDEGEVREPRARARTLIEAFIATDGVSAMRPASVRIDGQRGLSVDLTPIDSARVALFATAGSSYFLEPDRTTRIVVIDLSGKSTILIAIEPAEGYDLADIIETADPAAGTLRWR